MENHNEYTDGNLYTANDMVKLACGDCGGCFFCCQGMGTSIVLTPYDLYRLAQDGNRNQGFEKLLAEDKIELSVEDGMILPNLKMSGPGETCGFLDAQGRCSVHAFRPGLCRLFPLGRQYGEDSIRYIFLKDGCQKPNRTKIKIKKWLDVPDLSRQEAFLLDWHKFRKKIQAMLAQCEAEDEAKEWNLYLLELFYVRPYEEETDFYLQVKARIVQAEKLLKIS